MYFDREQLARRWGISVEGVRKREQSMHAYPPCAGFAGNPRRKVWRAADVTAFEAAYFAVTGKILIRGVAS